MWAPKTIGRIMSAWWWLEHDFYFPIQLGIYNHPNWLLYFSEEWLNHQSDVIVCMLYSYICIMYIYIYYTYYNIYIYIYYTYYNIYIYTRYMTNIWSYHYHPTEAIWAAKGCPSLWIPVRWVTCIYPPMLPSTVINLWSGMCMVHTLWLLNIAMENDLFIDDFSMKT